MLLALMAPRPVYVASASKDKSADAQAEFRACVATSPVWQLYDLSGVGDATRPGVGGTRHTGAIGYHLRAGKHNLTVEDCACYMDYIDRHFAPRSPAHTPPAMP